MRMMRLKKLWFHGLLWAAMLIYFMFAPDLLALSPGKEGRPIPAVQSAFVESDQIVFSVEGLLPYVQDGERLLSLYGWAALAPEDNRFTNPLTREIVLTSGERTYFFSVKSVYRSPELPDELANAAIDLENLGFSTLIAEDTIRPGKYRIGIIFRDTSGRLALYSDKPAYYLLKTPNTLRLERK